MNLIDKLSMEIFGISKKEALEKNICVDCKKPITDEESFHSPRGRAVYKISALCEHCFDKINPGE